MRTHTSTPGGFGEPVTQRQDEDNDFEPNFDFETIESTITDEDIKADVEDHINNVKQEHKEVLSKLLNEIQPIDFVALIRPEIKPLIEEMGRISSTDPNDRAKFLAINKPHGKDHHTRYAELEEEVKALRKSIKQKHYVVCIITELLKVAAKNKWDLCKRYDYVYVYNGAYWKQLSKDDLKYFLGEVAIKFSYPEIEALHHAFKDELLKQFIAQAHLPAPDHDADKILINLQNGTMVFNSNKWELRPFDPKDFLTYQLSFGFDPEAVCPTYDGYLLKVLPDTTSRMILQEFAGFIFTKMNLEKCLVLFGGGSNGKSVFFNILTALIGSENTLTYSMGLFNHEYNRSRLTNVLLNYSSEKGTDLNVETFKSLISGEPLQAREPYGKPFTINNKVKFILNCNELPKETESTDAYFRRYLIIPFDVKIPETDRDINLADNIIKYELTGVFNWLLRGLERLVKQQEFTQSSKVNDALADFKRQADNVVLFIEEFNYQPTTNEKRHKTLADLYSQYKTFCLEDGYKHLGKNKFSAKFESKGFTAKRSNDGAKGFLIEIDTIEKNVPV